VLIGGTAESLKDVVGVPILRDGMGIIAGVELHAAMVQQLLDVGLGRSAPLRVSDERAEVLLVLLFAVLGCALGLAQRSGSLLGVLAQLGLVLAGAVVLGAAGYGLFRLGWWVPAVAPALAWVAGVGVVTAWSSGRERAQRAMLMQLFSRYVSSDVAEDVWRHRDEFFTPEGRPRSRRLTATVLFADMKGYSSHAEKMDPELLMEWVNEFMGAMAHRVGASGGVVDDYFGDGLKANFGIPLPRASEQEIARDARSAVECALAMGRALEELNAEYRTRELPTVAMRIGIHTGPVVAGSLGSTEDRIKYTVVGDVVVTAQRLEALDGIDHDFGLAPCRILISGRTLALLDGTFRCEPLGFVALKGKDEAVEIHRVLGRA
jgi:adenylate cyclase